MSKRLDPFEKGLKDALDKHEVPYKEGSWEALEMKMGASSASSANSWAAAAVIVSLLLAIGAVWYFTSTSNAEASAQSAGLTRMLKTNGKIEGIREKTEDFLLAYADKRSVLDEIGNEPIDERVENERANEKTKPKLDLSTTSSDAGNAAEAADASVTAEETKDQPISTLPATGDKPAVPINVSTRQACAGTSVSFTIGAEVQDGNFLWNFGDGNFSNEPNPSHTYSKAGTYDITLSITSNEDGVIRTKTMDNLIVINPKPIANFDWSFAADQPDAASLQLHNRSSRAEKAEWIIGDKLSNEINPTEIITRKGEYDIELFVSNEFGCSDRTSKKVEINADYALMAPSQFSPDGDGVFDTFMPRALLNGEYDFVLRIFDEGELIFETSDPQKPWKGQQSDGSSVESSKELEWVAIINDRNGEKYYSGTVRITP